MSSYNIKICFCTIFLISILKLNVGAHNYSVFEFQDMKQCHRTEYYDLNYLTCMLCDTSGTNLQPSNDNFSCTCKSTSISTIVTYDILKGYIHCLDIDVCNSTTIPLNRNSTMKIFDPLLTYEQNLCNLNWSLNFELQQCKYIYINHSRFDRISNNKMIEMTFVNWYYDNLCQQCNPRYNLAYYNYCIAKSLMKPYLTFHNVYSENLKFLAFFCLDLHNHTACNHLVNLCVKSHHVFEKTSPCNSFLVSQTSETLFHYGNIIRADLTDRIIKPFLYFRKGKESTELITDAINNISFDNQVNDMENRMQFISVTYNLDGTLQYFGPLKLMELNLCAQFLPNKEIYFAVRQQFNCFISLENLIDLAQMSGNNKFLNLYFYYNRTDKPEKRFLQPIPILIKNLTNANNFQNMDEWLLVKRFLPISYISSFMGRSLTPTYDNTHKLNLYRSLRYIAKLEMHYIIHSQNQISVPLITLFYENIKFLNNMSLNQLYPFQMSITFEKRIEIEKIGFVRDIILPSTLILAICWAFIRYFIKQKNLHGNIFAHNRNDLCTVDLIFNEILLPLMNYMALALLCSALILIFMISSKFYIRYSMEVTVPLFKDEMFLNMLIYTALILKIVYLSIYFWRLIHFHIHFIDWERPRCDNSHQFILKDNGDGCKKQRLSINETGVSAWRTIYLANQWISLSCKNRWNNLLHNFIIYLLFQIIVKKYASTDDDLIMKLFIITLCYLLAYIAQYILYTIIMKYSEYNIIKQYVNLCSLANISVFVLIEPSYGFYIHGRSPHGFADSDMATMIAQSQREFHSLGSYRGLINKNDQCYIIMPPRQLNEYYDKLSNILEKTFSLWNNCNKTDSTYAGRNGPINITNLYYRKDNYNVENILEKTSQAYNSINRFFCAFIDHGIKGMDYITKEINFVENMCNCKFEQYLSDNKGTFYADHNYSFNRLFLYGNEWRLGVMRFLLLLTLYLQFRNILIALSVLCIFNQILRIAYRLMVKRNLILNTFIDQSYLI